VCGLVQEKLGEKKLRKEHHSEHIYDPSGSIKRSNILDHLRDYQLLKSELVSFQDRCVKGNKNEAYATYEAISSNGSAGFIRLAYFIESIKLECTQENPIYTYSQVAYHM
jgi:hypothetical protein